MCVCVCVRAHIHAICKNSSWIAVIEILQSFFTSYMGGNDIVPVPQLTSTELNLSIASRISVFPPFFSHRSC